MNYGILRTTMLGGIFVGLLLIFLSVFNRNAAMADRAAKTAAVAGHMQQILEGQKAIIQQLKEVRGACESR